ncbi:tRNA (guanine-N(7)-)-methyltransferase non-catalytic subunit trm82 [Lachnellula cervina]|uniref:tRNA (Guanine-N(7)-)-methyltransferase non-catalytic subunit trm82 n=1 Tax=Lachnellula cervina TaxID=1316786 RepID=A0A7D8ULS5_9HELO|nr:tRNA (guanine-N(7)-)-methyltransferase non-catalytic subunit trm82 [Lachnellula cervina]
MQMPYQCIEKCGNLLVAARGSNIELFNLSDGSFISTWRCPTTQGTLKAKPPVKEITPKLENQDSKSSSVDITIETSSPPTKRRKLSAGDDQDKNSTKEPKEDNKGGNKQTKKEKKQNNRLDSVASGLEAPAVIALAVTSDAQHVIAITGEDKSVRVFSLKSQDGLTHLNQLSQRQAPFEPSIIRKLIKRSVMPKRPSALTISEDNTTILSADKFGDVYSLPLIPSPSPSPNSTNPLTTPLIPEKEKPFKPSANELTIHSQRNRKALENQKRQKPPQPQKTEPDFEHTLLLGHVSLLTDVKLAKSGERSYVITSDRDEHIRISRGIPQTHVIEGFCLGHTEFISRICIPATRPEILIAGGGDDEIFVWEWEKSQLVSKVDLKSTVQDVVRGGKVSKIAVSTISWVRWRQVDLVLVTVEGIPALFTFHLKENNTLQHAQTLRLPGNALSITTGIAAPDGSPTRVLISVDSTHKPGSTTELSDSAEGSISPLQAFVFEDGKLAQDSFALSVVGGDDVSEGAVGGLRNLLYSLENLRKRDGEERGKEGENGADVAMGEVEAAQIEE